MVGKGWAHVPDHASIDSLISTVSSLFPDPQSERRAAQLTKRQMEVLTLAAANRSNSEIAAILFLSTGTVKRHLHEAYSRLGVKSRHEAATVLASWRPSDHHGRQEFETVSPGT